MSVRIYIDQERLAAFCHRHHIRKLSLFGSVLRDDFGLESDADVVVEFEPGHVPGLRFYRSVLIVPSIVLKTGMYFWRLPGRVVKVTTQPRFWSVQYT